MEYVNTCAESRVWPDLQDAEGRTLELEPGQTVELDAVIDDAWLKPGGTAPPAAPGASTFPSLVSLAAPAPAGAASTPEPEGSDVSTDTEPENEPDHTDQPATGEEH